MHKDEKVMEHTKEIKVFFLKKRVTAVIFVTLISVLFILNIWNLIKVKPEVKLDSLDSGAIETIVNENFYKKYSFIEAYGYIQKLMDKSEENNFEVVKDKSGKLHNADFMSGPNDVTEIVEKMKILKDRFEGTDTKVLSLMPPDKYIKGYTEYDTGMPYNYANETADKYLAALKENGIDYIDFRESILESSIDPQDFFYDTDHHWKIGTAFWAYTHVIDVLNERYGENIDPNGYYRNKENYNFVNYSNSYLGSLGRKAGQNYSGYDDFELVFPKFSTSYIFNAVTNGHEVNSNGRFEDALIANEVLKMEDLYDAQSDKYSAYLFWNQGLVKIHNNLMEDGRKVLIIKDSLAVPFAAFLSTVCSDVYLIDPRYYDGDILEYTSSIEGLDYVFVLFQPEDLVPQFFKW